MALWENAKHQAAEFYAEGSTDYHESFRVLRESAPEALFIASDTEDLILILPQLSFYEFGVQLLGTSAWNSSRLLRMAGHDMEGAIFPAVLGEQAAEEQFATAAAILDEPVGDVNPFLLGGYEGVKIVLNALQRSGVGGEGLREEMIRFFNNRRHPFLELASGQGIPFHTVRRERIEDFMTMTIGR